jgi:iron complex transport system ATP-binding protein
MSGNNHHNNNYARLKSEQMQVGYGDHTVIDGLSLSIHEGQITALVGPNGSGKSTLLKTLARLWKPSTGIVYLDGKAIHRMPTAEVARQLAILPQSPSIPAGLTVRELVEQGRYPHSGPLRMLRQQDHEAIQRAMELTSTLEFAERPVDSLSGGERQRAWIALTLAQDTSILLLDEPTSFLDIGYQLEVMELIEKLNRESGMTIVLVLHDLNQAARYAHRMIVIRQGGVVADGAPQAVLTAQLLESVFRVKARVEVDSTSGRPICLPYAFVS